MTGVTSSTVELRPRNVGEVLGLTFDLYRKNFPLFVGMAAVVVVPTLLLLSLSQILSLVIIAANPSALTGNFESSAAESVTGTLLLANFGSVCMGLLLYVAGAFWPWMEGALTHNVIERVLGRTPGLRASYNETRPRFAALWGSNALAQLGINATWVIAYLLLIILLLGAGAVAAASGTGDGSDGAVVALLAVLCMPVFLIGIVIAVVLAINWTFRAPVIVGEGVDGVQSLSRSTSLVRGDRWRIFGRYLLLYALVSLIVGVPTLILIGIVLGASWPTLASSVGSTTTPEFSEVFVPVFIAISVISLAATFISSLLVSPLYVIFTAVNYLDLRIRKENLAATLMAAPVTVTVTVSATGSITSDIATVTARPPEPAVSPDPIAPTPPTTPTFTTLSTSSTSSTPPVDLTRLPPGQRIGVLFNQLRTEGDNPQLLNNLGMAYMEIGDLGGAMDALTRARTLAPNDADITFNLMQVYLSRKDLRTAKQLMSEYARLETNPNDLSAVRNNPRYKDLID
jgi:hypothetical protein